MGLNPVGSSGVPSYVLLPSFTISVTSPAGAMMKRPGAVLAV